MKVQSYVVKPNLMVCNQKETCQFDGESKGDRGQFVCLGEWQIGSRTTDSNVECRHIIIFFLFLYYDVVKVDTSWLSVTFHLECLQHPYQI